MDNWTAFLLGSVQVLFSFHIFIFKGRKSGHISKTSAYWLHSVNQLHCAIEIKKHIMNDCTFKRKMFGEPHVGREFINTDSFLIHSTRT